MPGTSPHLPVIGWLWMILVVISSTSQAAEKESSVVGDPATGIYYLSHCDGYRRTLGLERFRYFRSQDDAVRSGYNRDQACHIIKDGGLDEAVGRANGTSTRVNDKRTAQRDSKEKSSPVFGDTDTRIYTMRHCHGYRQFLDSRTIRHFGSVEEAKQAGYVEDQRCNSPADSSIVWTHNKKDRFAESIAGMYGLTLGLQLQKRQNIIDDRRENDIDLQRKLEQSQKGRPPTVDPYYEHAIKEGRINTR